LKPASFTNNRRRRETQTNLHGRCSRFEHLYLYNDAVKRKPIDITAKVVNNVKELTFKPKRLINDQDLGQENPSPRQHQEIHQFDSTIFHPNHQ
jgi:hypothetical protein